MAKREKYLWQKNHIEIKECCSLLGYSNNFCESVIERVVSIENKYMNPNNIRRVFGEKFPGFFSALSKTYGKTISETNNDLINGVITKEILPLVFVELLKYYKN